VICRDASVCAAGESCAIGVCTASGYACGADDACGSGALGCDQGICRVRCGPNYSSSCATGTTCGQDAFCR
jgi:hypothetical protein